MTPSPPPNASQGSTQIDPSRLDVPVLVGLVAPAVERHVLDTLKASGFEGVRAVHGYVFQRLQQGPCPVGELASDLDVTQQRISTLVEELVQAGYVQREQRPGDGRVRDVVLTDRGRGVIALARRARTDLEARLEEEIGDVEPVRAALAALLTMTSDIAEVAGHRVPIPTA